MKLIVGLGNPGKAYQQTRHNIGFIVIDQLLSEHNLSLKVNSKFDAAIAETTINQEKIIFAKPLTFMNLSGDAVQKMVNFYKLPLSDLLIISDDTALPLGKVRLRDSGSHGGQNGLRSIIDRLATQAFKRIRIGIGYEDHIPMADYVLGKLTKTDIETLMPSFDLASRAIKEWIETNDFSKIIMKYNTPQAK